MQLARQDRLEVRVLRVLQGLQEPIAQYLDLQDQLALRAPQGQQVPQERRVQQGQLVPLGPQDQRVQ